MKFACGWGKMVGAGVQNLEWAEPLPPSCPPAEAKSPNGDQFYRLVTIFPPTRQDFHSYRMLYPTRSFQLGECIARAVSLMVSYEDCGNIMKLPRYKSNNRTVIMIILPPESGMVLQTGLNRSHFSWWRAMNFDPIPCCQKVTA
jgi:hypothetical protein